MKILMYNILRINFVILVMIFSTAMTLCAQEEEQKPVDRPVTDIFESNFLIDNQTVLVPISGTLEFDILHRFGTWDNGYDDFFGIYAPSNIRIGFSYVPINKLQIGFGLTKEKNLWDVNAKYSIINQTRSGKVPLSVTYYGNMAADTRDGANFRNDSDRYSFFHQLMIARKFSDKISIQASGNVSHFNAVDAFVNEEMEIEGIMNNDHISFSLLGKYRLTDITSFIVNYDQPITDHKTNNPNPNISFGVEFVTSSHAFQLFVGNYKSIVPQYNHFFNQNNFSDNEILIGFNMTRLWNF